MTSRHTDNSSSRHPRQALLLIAAGTLIAIAVALILVVTLRGSDGPSAGSPDAVTDQLASALQAHSGSDVVALACPGQQHQLRDQASSVLRNNQSAVRDGSADVNGSVAVARIKLAVAQHYELPGPSGAMTSSSTATTAATVGLQHPDGADWCVAAFAVALPTH